MRIKKIFRTLPFLLGTLFYEGYAQSGITSGGGDIQLSDGASVSFSLGQMDYLFSGTNNGSVSAGVQQPFEIIKGKLCDGMDIQMAPNPTRDIVYVAMNEEGVTYTYIITDMNGKKFDEGTLTNGSKISFGFLADNTYLLKVICGESKNDFVAFKIVKYK